MRPRRLAFGRDERGTLAVGFSLAAFGMVSMAGFSLDYANASNQRAKLQAIADGAVMAGVRHFRLGTASESVVRETVSGFVQASADKVIGTVTVEPMADAKARTVSATLTANIPTYLIHIIGKQYSSVSVKASAKLAGGAPVCVLGLEEEKNGVINLEKSAVLSAPGCAIYSNSRKPDGLRAKETASLKASFICSAGGKVADKFDAFAPAPRTDCPVLRDPLRSRPLPAAGACVATDMVITGSTVNLTPGTYCGGLKIRSGSRVTLTPGVYIFRGGKLDVGGGSTLTGINVGLHFSGSSLQFDPDSSVSLTAPKNGIMAGLLISEERKNPEDQKFNILSNDARMLLGTIYLPQGRLFIGANKPVADQSAYTIVVARMFSLSEGPTMVLNTNYGSTDIPVPDGVGPGGAAELTQ